MNKNIEVINKNLWAVRFHLLPFIKEIEYTPFEEVPAYEEPFRLVKKNGLFLLNKDHKGYELIKDAIIMAMNKKEKQLEKQLLILKKMKGKNNYHIILEGVYTMELERRVFSEMAHSLDRKRGILWPQ